MNISCTLTIACGSTKKARHVLHSIKVDDFDFVTSTVKGKNLEAVIKSKSVSSLLHTLDDYLACVSVADSIVNKD